MKHLPLIICGLLILAFIFVCSYIVHAGNPINFLTKGQADTLYCSLPTCSNITSNISILINNSGLNNKTAWSMFANITNIMNNATINNSMNDTYLWKSGKNENQLLNISPYDIEAKNFNGTFLFITNNSAVGGGLPDRQIMFNLVHFFSNESGTPRGIYTEVHNDGNTAGLSNGLVAMSGISIYEGNASTYGFNQGMFFNSRNSGTGGRLVRNTALEIIAQNQGDQMPMTTTQNEALRIDSATIGAVQNVTTNYGIRIFGQTIGKTNYAIFTNDGLIDFADNVTIRKNLTAPKIYDNFVTATARPLHIDSTGQVGVIASTKEYKKDIQNISGASWIYQLNPVSFRYKTTNEYSLGLIAEDVALINPDLVTFKRIPIIKNKTWDYTGDSPYYLDYIISSIPETVNYESPYMITGIIKELQNKDKEIQELKAWKSRVCASNPQYC